jgi:hypothetical protein
MITPENLENWFTYHSPTDSQLLKYKEIREAAKAFAEVIVISTPVCADQATAIRKIREVEGPNLGVRGKDQVIYLPTDIYYLFAANLPTDISMIDASYKGSNRVLYANLNGGFPLVKVVFRPLSILDTDKEPK